MSVSLRLTPLLGMLGLASGCAAQGPGGRLTTLPAGCTQPWAQGIGDLLENGKYAEAEELYRAVIAVSPTDACAMEGIAALELRPASPQTLPAQIGSGWSTVSTDVVGPVAPAVLAALAVLVFLLVLARLVTPMAVSPVDRSWSSGTRTWLFRLGVTALVVAVGATITSTTLGWTSTTAHPAVLAAVLAVLAVLGAAACAADVARARTGRRLSLLSGTLVAGAVLAAVAFYPGGSVAEVLAGLALAVPGVGLVATARGHALALAVDVRTAAGSADEGAGRYLVSALSGLGTRAPAGLKTPEQTDVTSLPADALTALPAAAGAKALFEVARALLPGVPWRAVATFQDTETVTVHLLRNGHAAAAPLTIRASQLHAGGPAPGGDGGAARTERRLLLAAATHILVELGTRHEELRIGLGGATRWRSLALHAIATDRGDPPAQAERDALVTAAVADDPGNALARVADLARLGRETTPDGQRRAADAARHELERLEGEDGSFEPLRLRLRFLAAASHVNALLLDPAGPEKGDPGAAGRALVGLVGAVREEGLADRTSIRPLLSDLRRGAAFMVLTLDDLAGPQLDRLRWRQRRPEWSDAREWARTCVATMPDDLPAVPSYDRACWRATVSKGDRQVGWQRAALVDLRRAVTEPHVRLWAREDPSLARLRDADDDHAAEFATLVGDPPVAQFVELSIFTEHRAALVGLGIRSAEDLLAVPDSLIVTKTGAAPSVVRRWKGVARLAAPDGRAEAMPVGLLEVVVACGVTSRDQLRSRLRSAACVDTWHSEVRRRAAAVSLAPGRQQWCAYAGLGPWRRRRCAVGR